MTTRKATMMRWTVRTATAVLSAVVLAACIQPPPPDATSSYEFWSVEDVAELCEEDEFDGDEAFAAYSGGGAAPDDRRDRRDRPGLGGASFQRVRHA